MTTQSAADAAEGEQPPADVPGASQETPPERPAGRPRGRTARLMAAAAVLGLVAGAATGYAVQYRRPPTVRPLLAAQPSHPAHRAAPAGARLTAADDDEVRTDGDLRALLVSPPVGSRAWPAPPTADGWETLAQYAEGFKRPAQEFRWENSNGFRRAVWTGWTVGRTSYGLQLVQYTHADEGSAESALRGERDARSDRAVTPLPGTGDGFTAAAVRPVQNSSWTFYDTEAVARHGDIVVMLFVDAPEPVGRQTAEDLMHRQLERL